MEHVVNCKDNLCSQCRATSRHPLDLDLHDELQAHLALLRAASKPLLTDDEVRKGTVLPVETHPVHP